MGKAKKSTRKYEKNHLKDTLERRKGVAPIKQRQRLQLKKKKRKNTTKNNEAKGEQEVAEDGPSIKMAGQDLTRGAKDMENMNVDEFFQDAVEIPERPKKRRVGKKESATRKRQQTGVEGDMPTDDGDDGDEDDDDDDANRSTNSSVEDHVLSQRDRHHSESSAEDDIDAHRRDLEALAENDPTFYRYLQENDEELLRADGGLDQLGRRASIASENDEAGIDARARDDADDVQSIAEDGEESSPDGNMVTSKMLEKWKTGLTDLHSLRALREVVLAFRAAAHLNDTDEQKKYKYSVSDADVYHQLLLLALKHVPDVLQHHLPVKETQSGKIRLQTDTKKFRNLSATLKSHAISLHHLLDSLTDAATLKLTLSSIVPLLPYFLSFKKFLRTLIKSVVAVWSDTANTEATRIAAFLVLRRLLVIGDAGLRELSLKSVYQGLVKGSRNTNVHTISGVNLMLNSAAELWRLDSAVGYTTGFTFIRQLAIHLRGCITNPTKDSYKTVYNWQFVHSLDFWSRVLALDCSSAKEAEVGKESALRPLIYPVVQITLGTLRLIPTAQYFPLRFQLIRSSLRVAGSTGTYIPLAPALLEVLQSVEMRKAPKPSTLKPLDFTCMIRASKAYLRTRVYQDAVGEQVTELLTEYLVQWTKSIAFVEMALPIIVMLKRWLKEVSSSSSSMSSSSHRRTGKGKGNANGRLNSAVTFLLQKLEANSRWIEEHRAKVEFAPNDRAGVESFLKDVDWTRSPLGAFVVGQRRQREQHARLIEKGRRREEEEGERTKSKKLKTKKVVNEEGMLVQSSDEPGDD